MKLTEKILDGIKKAIAEGGKVDINLTEASALTGSGSDVGGNVVSMAVARPIGNPPTTYLVSPLAGGIYRQVGSQVSRKLSRGGGTSLSGLVPHSRATAPTAAGISAYTDQQLDDFVIAKYQPRQALVYNPAEATRTVL